MHIFMYTYMPVIIRYKNVKICIFPDDHSPAHVIAPDCEAKFTLKPVDCYFCRGFKEKFIKEMKKYLEQRVDILMEAWNEYQS